MYKPFAKWFSIGFFVSFRLYGWCNQFNKLSKKGGFAYEKYNFGYVNIRGYPEQGIVALTKERAPNKVGEC